MEEQTYPNYDRVVHVSELPSQVTRGSQGRTHGYAVELGGAIGSCVVFFYELEPALVFGRAGRMSSVDIKSYGVFAATRVREPRGRIGATLYLTGSNLDRHDDEAEAFRRWLEGTTPTSAHYRPVH